MKRKGAIAADLNEAACVVFMQSTAQPTRLLTRLLPLPRFLPLSRSPLLCTSFLRISFPTRWFRMSAPFSSPSSSSGSVGHVVLLGDSIFDNASYVRGGPDVVTHLRGVLPAGWKATLLAVDGAVTDGVASQLSGMPADATHVVISAGGNDALGASGLLEQPCHTVAEAVGRLASLRVSFRQRYERMLSQVASRCPAGAAILVASIYDSNHPEPCQSLITTGLCAFNDGITRAAFARRYGLIDLRVLCDRPEDYANPIEPSVEGGRKIAMAIAAAVKQPKAIGSLVIASADQHGSVGGGNKHSHCEVA